MNTTFAKGNRFAGLTLSALLLFGTQLASAAEVLKALIVDGQNNHNWRATTPILRAALVNSGLFTVDIATSPAQGQDMEGFTPAFAKYDVVVLNYNGDSWAPATRTAFEDYMRNGGGLVIVHAADNSFPRWVEFNKMIGVGGWGNRTQDSGPMIRWRNGKQILEVGTAGSRGTHGKYFSWEVDMRNSEHPITRDLPQVWLHARDELYSMLAGPAQNVTVLATAKSDTSHQDEPILMTIRYGKGRVFHTTMGHDVESMKDVGFVTTLDRGAEWAATGQVTIPIPAAFPTADKVSVWNPSSK
ncbi:MAG TPA: ThuA domain-containing protein [Lacipirellulaceae bacterium]|nr:ThuA domain-containing protein [Lacipirellulaceae bacterium]